MGEENLDLATLEMIDKAKREGVSTIFERAAALEPCSTGMEGSCCNYCSAGPCAIPSSEGERGKGVCGATPETIAARNFLRMVAAGAATQADQARTSVELLMLVAQGKAPGYAIKDEQKLLKVALDLGVTVDERTDEEIALAVAEKALEQLSRQDGGLSYMAKAPLRRQSLWREVGVAPRGIDREVIEALHHTNMGIGQDYHYLLLQAARTSLAGGWGSAMLATELEDVIFGTPAPVLSQVGLGVLKEDEVNILVAASGYQILEMLARMAKDPDLIEYAQSKGAKGINIATICGTAPAITMWHGVPTAGGFVQQELALITGAVEAMVVDGPCMMHTLTEVARPFHTKIIITHPSSKMEGAIHTEFNYERAEPIAKELIRAAIDNFCHRTEVSIPPYRSNFVTGFSYETLNYLLGGLYRASLRVLNDNIINGRIRGLAIVFGGNNPRVNQAAELEMTKELIKNDVLVLQSGCVAMTAARAGLMLPEAAGQFAGPGLGSVCEAVGLPPVIHLGSCIDTSRALILAAAMVKEGGLGEDLDELPVAASAPAWMSEGDITMGQCLVASGVYTVFGVTWPTLGSGGLTRHLFQGLEDIYGGRWAFEADPVQIAHLMIENIDRKRRGLGLNRARERVLYDMQMRREIGSA